MLFTFSRKFHTFFFPLPPFQASLQSCKSSVQIVRVCLMQFVKKQLLLGLLGSPYSASANFIKHALCFTLPCICWKHSIDIPKKHATVSCLIFLACLKDRSAISLIAWLWRQSIGYCASLLIHKFPIIR